MPYSSLCLTVSWTCRNSGCKHTFCLLVLVCHMIIFHMKQPHVMFETLMTYRYQVVLLGICQMQSDIQRWQCHGVCSCHKAWIRENLCCPVQSKTKWCGLAESGSKQFILKNKYLNHTKLILVSNLGRFARVAAILDFRPLECSEKNETLIFVPVYSII